MFQVLTELRQNDMVPLVNCSNDDEDSSGKARYEMKTQMSLVRESSPLQHMQPYQLWSQIKGRMPINTVPMKTVPIKTEPIKTVPMKTVPIKTEPIKTVPIKTEPIQDAFQGWELRILGLKSCRMLLLKRKLPRFLWRIKNTKLETPRNDLDYNNYCLECKYIPYYWHLLFVSGLGQCYDTTSTGGYL